MARRAKLGPADAALPVLETLSFVRAEVCLPALKEAALFGAAARYQALDGIARVGGRAAVETLLEIFEAPDEELRPGLLRHLSSFCDDYPDLVSPALEATEGGFACAGSR